MHIETRNIFAGKVDKRVKSYPCDWWFFLKTYGALVNKDMTVVEIGCSVIPKTRDLARQCKKLIGIEIDKEKIFKYGGNIEIINGDWQDLSSILGKDSIDLVVSSHVIEHVPDDLRAINETYEVLKNGGSLMFITPNKNRLSRFAARLFGLENKLTYAEHIREYGFNELMDLITKSKFKQFSVEGSALGLHTGPFLFYFKRSPLFLRNFVNFWEVHLKK